MLRETFVATPYRVVSTKRQFITGSLSGGVLVPEDSASSIEGDLPTVADTCRLCVIRSVLLFRTVAGAWVLTLRERATAQGMVCSSRTGARHPRWFPIALSWGQGNSVSSSSSKASESGPSVGSSSTHDGCSKLSHIRNALCSAARVGRSLPSQGE